MMIETHLRAPAQINSRTYFRARPVKDFRQLFPISYILKRYSFNRSTRNNHSLILFRRKFIEISVEHVHVFLRSVLILLSANLYKDQLNGQIGFRKLPRYVAFRNLFYGHKVQKQNTQGLHALRNVGIYLNTLRGEFFYSRQILGNIQWHD